MSWGSCPPAGVLLRGRSPRWLRATIPSFRPQPRGTPPPLFTRHDSVLCYFQASPLSCRLAAIPRRNRFVNLRTDSSLPVTPHPASRRRSYLQLRSCGQLRQGLSPCKWHAITGVHETARAVEGSGQRVRFMGGPPRGSVCWRMRQPASFSSRSPIMISPQANASPLRQRIIDDALVQIASSAEMLLINMDTLSI